MYSIINLTVFTPSRDLPTRIIGCNRSFVQLINGILIYKEKLNQKQKQKHLNGFVKQYSIVGLKEWSIASYYSGRKILERCENSWVNYELRNTFRKTLLFIMQDLKSATVFTTRHLIGCWYVGKALRVTDSFCRVCCRTNGIAPKESYFFRALCSETLQLKHFSFTTETTQRNNISVPNICQKTSHFYIICLYKDTHTVWYGKTKCCQENGHRLGL